MALGHVENIIKTLATFNGLGDPAMVQSISLSHL